jgi:hypothetical protein
VWRARPGGAGHPDTLTALSNLALLYDSRGKGDLALPMHEEVLAARRGTLGEADPQTLNSLNNLVGRCAFIHSLFFFYFFYFFYSLYFHIPYFTSTFDLPFSLESSVFIVSSLTRAFASHSRCHVLTHSFHHLPAHTHLL